MKPADGREQPNLDGEEHRIRRACERQNAIAACNTPLQHKAIVRWAGLSSHNWRYHTCTTAARAHLHRPARHRIAPHAPPQQHTCTGDCAKLGLSHRQQPRAIDAVRDEIRLRGNLRAVPINARAAVLVTFTWYETANEYAAETSYVVRCRQSAAAVCADAFGDGRRLHCPPNSTAQRGAARTARHE